MVIPNVGHSVLDSDLSGCADDATRLFFAGKPVPPSCSRTSRDIQDLLAVLYPPTPVAPGRSALDARDGSGKGRADRSARWS